MDYPGLLYSFIAPYLPNLFWAVIVVAATKIVFCSFNDIMRYFYLKYQIPKRNYLIIRNVFLLLVYVVAAVLILLSIPGVDEKVLTLIGIGVGVLVSISSTSTVGNLVSGIIIHLTRPVMEGDHVEINGVVGDVISIELLFMHVKTVRNELVSIPNLQVLTNRIVNYSSMDYVAVSVPLSIGYSEGPARVKKLLTQAAVETKGIAAEQKPFVLVKELGNYAVTYELNAYTKHQHNFEKVRSNLCESIVKAFSHEGVEIMSPMFVNTAVRDRGERELAAQKDTESIQHEVTDHHKNIEELQAAKEQFAEKRRSPTTLEEKHREQYHGRRKKDERDRLV